MCIYVCVLIYIESFLCTLHLIITVKYVLTYCRGGEFGQWKSFDIYRKHKTTDTFYIVMRLFTNGIS